MNIKLPSASSQDFPAGFGLRLAAVRSVRGTAESAVSAEFSATAASSPAASSGTAAALSSIGNRSTGASIGASAGRSTAESGPPTCSRSCNALSWLSFRSSRRRLSASCCSSALTCPASALADVCGAGVDGVVTGFSAGGTSCRRAAPAAPSEPARQASFWRRTSLVASPSESAASSAPAGTRRIAPRFSRLILPANASGLARKSATIMAFSDTPLSVFRRSEIAHSVSLARTGP